MNYKTREGREVLIVKIKKVMKELATINLDISDGNKQWINDVNDNLKTLCELMDYQD